VFIWPFSVTHPAVTDSDSTVIGSLLVTDILFVFFVHRIESMEVEDDRFRFFIVGTKAEKGVTVRFNVVRWTGILAGDMRYASSDVSSLHHTVHPRREPRFPVDHSKVTEAHMSHKIHSDFVFFPLECCFSSLDAPGLVSSKCVSCFFFTGLVVCSRLAGRVPFPRVPPQPSRDDW